MEHTELYKKIEKWEKIIERENNEHTLKTKSKNDRLCSIKTVFSQQELEELGVVFDKNDNIINFNNFNFERVR